jgi:VanZ family protein
MYGGTCSVIWYEYVHKHTALDKWKVFLFAWLAPIVMSGIIELMQEHCTTTRSGEWLDFLANSTGVTLAVPVGLLLFYIKVLNKNARHDSLR